MKRFIGVLVAITMLISMFGNALCAEVEDFNLIEYLQINEVSSREELMSVISFECNSSVVGMCTYPQAYACALNEQEVSFNIEIDYDNQIVIVDTIYETNASTYTTSGRAFRDVCSSQGNLLFTIEVNGVFARTSQTVTATSVTGSFYRPAGSNWNSSPSLTKGFISRTKAYARISGVASTGSESMNYTLTLMCDTSGTLTSSFSS